MMGTLLGIILHAIGGLASGSFYVPFKRVKEWAWESYWLVNGFFAWLIMPWLLAWLTIPDFMDILLAGPKDAIMWCYIFGLLWGIGGFTFGLTMRYLGLSLGMAVALGLCAAFGTIIPPIYSGEFMGLLDNTSGRLILLGVLVCLIGIAICGWAGFGKDREVSEEEKKASIKEFNFNRGLIVAIICGILSACFAFGVAAGEPLAQMAVEHGANPLWKTGISYIPILLGGFTLNFVWCGILNIRNKTAKNYVDTNKPMANNYFFASLAGIVWYQQFMFYGMGTSYMGDYDFASWTLHMAFIIVFSTCWGLYYGEWKGVSKKTSALIVSGLAVVILSTMIIGYGNYLGNQ